MKFNKRYWFALPVFLLFTLLFYAPIHEAAHYLAGSSFGWKALEVRLVPEIWKGEFFKAAYVTWESLGRPFSTVVTCLAPYFVDVIFAGLRFFLAASKFGKNRLIFWSVFLCLVWGPAFNTIHNLVGSLFTQTDITIAAEYSSPWLVYTVIIGFSGIHIFNFRDFISHQARDSEVGTEPNQ